MHVTDTKRNLFFLLDISSIIIASIHACHRYKAKLIFSFFFFLNISIIDLLLNAH
jgi:hypothetical protein